MIDELKQSLWKQFGASIDMVENSIRLWPDAEWETDKRFFYMAYHVLIFLDYYLTIPAGNLTSPLSFTLVEPDDIPAGALDDIIPDRIYTKQELLSYLQDSRERCRQLINGLTEESLAERWVEIESDKNLSVLELFLYNMRHVQHHAAQLNLLLREKINDAPKWVRQARKDL